MFRKLLFLAPAAQTLVLLYVVQPATAYAEWCGADAVDKSKPGVLISGQIKPDSGGFACYLNRLLIENMPYVILVAVLLVVASGIQYMLAQGNPSAQGAAKTRIIGILTGVIFYYLLRYILPLVIGGVSL